MSARLSIETMFNLNMDTRVHGRFTRTEIRELRDLCENALTVGHPQNYSWRTIALTTCDQCGLEWDELVSTSRRRSHRVAWPRQIAMALTRKMTNMSLGAIGQAYGGRDHGTVLHAITVVEARRATITDGRIIRSIEAALEAQKQQETEQEPQPELPVAVLAQP